MQSLVYFNTSIVSTSGHARAGRTITPSTNRRPKLTLSQAESFVFWDPRADVIALALKWERRSSQFISAWEKKTSAFRLQTDLGIHPEGNREAFAAGGSLSLVEVFLKEPSSERALRQTPGRDFTAHQTRGSAAPCCGENLHHVILLALKETFESICRRVVSALLCSLKGNFPSSGEIHGES